MRGRRLRDASGLLLVVLVAGCAYFNALYNARRLHRDAEAAANRGDEAAAQAAHRESLEKAARSLEQDPHGRWSDDALLLVGQNQFALGDCAAAQAALRRVLRETNDAEVAAWARAYLGAATYCLGEPELALPVLDEAVAALSAESPAYAFARVWRARARFDLGRPDSAWDDLAAAAARADALGRTAMLEQIVRGIEVDRPDQALAGFHALLRDPAGDLHADSVRALVRAASRTWGGAQARAALEPAPRAPWRGEIRDLLIVERATQAAAAGDTALALAELEQAATRSAENGANAARLEIARLRLASVEDPSELAPIRTVLLPALADREARTLINAIGVIGSLLEQAGAGQPLALFAAAEVARDRLRARALARRLFVGYADVAGTGAWSSKALLAALALDPPVSEAAGLSARVANANDVYATAARGSGAPGYEDSETRLGQALAGLIDRANRDVQQRDISVGQAIAQIDSVTAAVRADSVALSCGSLADSLGLAGVRRDSVLAACRREDVALVDSFMRVDTLALRDSTAAALQDPITAIDTSRQ